MSEIPKGFIVTAQGVRVAVSFIGAYGPYTGGQGKSWAQDKVSSDGSCWYFTETVEELDAVIALAMERP